jgi:hypothetical protein
MSGTRRDSSPWLKSPQQTDPLSWYTRSRFPLVFSVLMIALGIVSITAFWSLLWHPWIEIVAFVFASAAMLVIVLSARPMRAVRHATASGVPVGLMLAAIALATVNAASSTVAVQYWWVPMGVAYLVGALAPFVTVRRTLLNGITLTVAAGIAAFVGFAGTGPVWTTASVVLITINTTVGASAAAVTVAWILVTTTQRVFDKQRPNEPATESDADIALRVERRTLARLGTRVAPFLQGIADTGTITAEDRSLAGQMARRLRTDLIGQANRTWLDSIALFGPLYVVDPDHRANQMASVQRVALRGLLEAIMSDPVTRDGSLLIELRGQPDGSTAVGITVDVNLPEGRRVAMIAPYYLTLQTAVNDLHWDSTKESLNFTMPTPGTPGGAS